MFIFKHFFLLNFHISTYSAMWPSLTSTILYCTTIWSTLSAQRVEKQSLSFCDVLDLSMFCPSDFSNNRPLSYSTVANIVEQKQISFLSPKLDFRYIGWVPGQFCQKLFGQWPNRRDTLQKGASLNQLFVPNCLLPNCPGAKLFGFNSMCKIVCSQLLVLKCPL